MSTFIIGDVHGCYNELQALLSKMDYAYSRDDLWFVGDVINRGPESLKTLQFLKNLPRQPIITLGNHDLHFLACASGAAKPKPKDTFHDILNSPDCNRLADWLRHQPLIHYDKQTASLLVHAGIPPHWDLPHCLAQAQRVEQVLRGPNARQFFETMYGNKPDHCTSSHTESEQLRTITNYLTRMRFCSPDGRVTLDGKSTPGSQADGYYPWFLLDKQLPTTLRVFFGHWASLGGRLEDQCFTGLDTGCVWGSKLTGLRLDDGHYFQVSAEKNT